MNALAELANVIIKALEDGKPCTIRVATETQKSLGMSTASGLCGSDNDHRLITFEVDESVTRPELVP